MGYLNPALNNPAQKIKYNSVAFIWTVTHKVRMQYTAVHESITK